MRIQSHLAEDSNVKKFMKKTALWLSAFLCLAVQAVPVQAAGNVTYDGAAKSFIFEPGSEESPTDLFDEFKNVMPGDSLTEKITVTNRNVTQSKLRIYLRSLGAEEASKDFLSRLTLKVEENGSNLFEAPSHETASLTDWVLLGTLSPGGSADLSVTLTVPLELDNQYADTIGYLNWEFMVEEVPDEKTPTLIPDSGQDSSKGDGHVKTGDTSKPLLWAGLALGCAAVAVIVVVVGKKHKNRKD